MNEEYQTIRKLVGDITPDQLKYVDYFISGKLGLFIPAVGPCFYAITADHTHPGYSFVLNFDDNCDMFINNSVITSVPGKISAVSPDVPHHEILTGSFARYIAIIIEHEYFRNECAGYDLYQKKLFKGEMFTPGNELRPLLKDFMGEYENKLPGYRQLLDAIALRITHSIIRAVYGIGSVKQESSNRMHIDRVVEFIHSNYSEKMDVHTLASVAALSPSHFSRLFKIHTGRSPMSYLIETRLEKSKKLLFSGDYSVTEVAYKTGFSSSSHFSNLFCQRFKITPNEYRRSMR